MIIIILCVVIVVVALWGVGESTRKTLEAIENEAEDAYWLLEDAKKLIDEAEIEDKDEPLTL